MSKSGVKVYRDGPGKGDIRDLLEALPVANVKELGARAGFQHLEAIPVYGVDDAIEELLKDVVTQKAIAEGAPRLLKDAFDSERGCYWESIVEGSSDGEGTALLTLNLVVAVVSGGRLLFPTHVARKSAEEFALWEVVDVKDAESALQDVHRKW